MTHWVDVSSWSQSEDREARKTPKTWELSLCGETLICVSRHIHCPGTWIMRVDGLLSIPTKDLMTDDVDEAKERALAIVFKALNALYMEMTDLLPCEDWHPQGPGGSL